MIIDCIGCLHGHRPKLEGGDLLIVTGDLTARDSLFQHSDFLEWLHRQDYQKKVLVPGNHDTFLEKNPKFYSMSHIDYLCDSGTEFTFYEPLEKDGAKEVKRKTFNIWGSPWTDRFPGINPKCCAFTEYFGCDSDEWLDEHWQMIPKDTDILITHGPPYDIFDQIADERKVGSGTLLLKSMEIKPKLHVFSHIHEQGGKEILMKHEGPNTWYVNCSIMNEHYKPVHKPMRIIL